MRIIIIIIALALSGCLARTIQLDTRFDPKEAAYINEKGANAIEGQAFLQRRDGIVVYAAGSDVYLIPATRYARERIEKIYRGAKLVDIYAAGATKTPDNPEFRRLSRTTKADGEGRFRFENVADGDYFVQTAVVWQPGDFAAGGALVDLVSVNGADVSVVLSGR